MICDYGQRVVYSQWKKRRTSSALLLPGHVVVAWKLLQKQCTFGNQGLSSHSEKQKRQVFVILS